MPKLVPAIADRFEKEKPEEYGKFIAPRSIKFLDASGFPQAFDKMAELYKGGKTSEAEAIRAELVKWVSGNRRAAQQEPRVDPEVERLKSELATRDKGEESQKVNTAYSAVVEHAGPVIDKVLKPIVAKLGLSTEQYKTLRNHVWSDLQETRNSNEVYKTVAPSKQRAGYDKWAEYAKGWTADNAAESARKMAHHYYGHQLKNGAVSAAVDATKQPGSVATITQGKMPDAGEIDYGPRGTQAARKAGFKDVADMLLSGRAPMKSGGIRKWR
jgi:hypothetical protein